MTRNSLTGLGLAAALVIVAADQASKWWVLNVIRLPEVGQIVLLPVLNLTIVWNRGVTFGLLNSLGDWSALVLAAVALAVVAALGVWLRRAELTLVAIALGSHRRRRGQQRDRPPALRRGDRLRPRPCRRLVLVRVQPGRCRHRVRRGDAGPGQPAAARAKGARAGGCVGGMTILRHARFCG